MTEQKITDLMNDATQREDWDEMARLARLLRAELDRPGPIVFTPFVTEGTRGDLRGLAMLPDDGMPLRARIELDEFNRGLWEADAGSANGVLLTDERTGIIFRAVSADCGEGCRCAAEITEVTHNPSEDEQ